MGVDSDSPPARRFPVRTCIGCRQRAAKDDLLRVVRIGSQLVADPMAVHTGRGAYLHRQPACLELAIRRRAFARALGIRGEADLSAVTAAVEQDVRIDRSSRTLEGAQDEHPMNGKP